MTRLSAAALADARGADVPTYDRSHPPVHVHLGVGAFARAHVAVYADDLLRAGHPATIRGVSLRSHRAEEQLTAQDGLFTVTVREPSAPPTTRVIGALTSVTTGRPAAVDAIADAATSFVTLTVTEKGYELGGPSAAPAVVAAGLDERRRAGRPGVVVASLDNVLDNGNVLRRRVLDAAGELDGCLSRWIEDEVRFPRSVVDRMVPATTEADLADVRERLGLVDLAAVVAEKHRSWVVESADGMPPFAEVGVEVVADVGPYQRRKLWLLNLPHSAVAYAGLLAGHDTIASAVDDPAVAGFVRRLVDDVVDVADDAGPSPAAFAEASIRRFRNGALGHTCAQVGADGSRKLPQRLLPVVARRRERDLPTARLAVVVAAWLAAVRGAAVEDPSAGELRGGSVRQAVELAVGAEHASWVPEVVAACERVSRLGIAALEDEP